MLYPTAQCSVCPHFSSKGMLFNYTFGGFGFAVFEVWMDDSGKNKAPFLSHKVVVRRGVFSICSLLQSSK